MKPKCHYCGGEVVFGPGMIMVEVLGDTESLVAHEECYQQSGDDEGYIERLHQTLEDEEIE